MFNCSSLKAVNVVENNTEFTSIDGILYDKDLTTIKLYPPAKEDEEYEPPETFERCRFGKIFYNCFNLKNFNISENSIEVKSVNGLLYLLSSYGYLDMFSYPPGRSSEDFSILYGIIFINDIN